jgi:hypothetical protein
MSHLWSTQENVQTHRVAKLSKIPGASGKLAERLDKTMGWRNTSQLFTGTAIPADLYGGDAKWLK